MDDRRTDKERKKEEWTKRFSELKYSIFGHFSRKFLEKIGLWCAHIHTYEQTNICQKEERGNFLFRKWSSTAKEKREKEEKREKKKKEKLTFSQSAQEIRCCRPWRIRNSRVSSLPPIRSISFPSFVSLRKRKKTEKKTRRQQSIFQISGSLPTSKHTRNNGRIERTRGKTHANPTGVHGRHYKRARGAP